jgi:hypothetical protein
MIGGPSIKELSHKHQKEHQYQNDLQNQHRIIKKFISQEIEPLLTEYISKLTSEISYKRQVDVEFQWTRPWEFSVLRSTTFALDQPKTEGDVAVCSGRGIWHLFLDDAPMNYEIIVKWNVPKKYLAISLTKPRLERLLLGQYVPNVPGDESYYMSLSKQKLDNSVIDKVRETIEMFTIGVPEEIPEKYKNMDEDEDEIVVITTGKDEDKSDNAAYYEIENEMKKAIQSLGWKWKDIDKNRMDRCIKETISEDGKTETCIKKYLEKGERGD